MVKWAMLFYRSLVKRIYISVNFHDFKHETPALLTVLFATEEKDIAYLDEA
jgi:hypothetical protein